MAYRTKIFLGETKELWNFSPLHSLLRSNRGSLYFQLNSLPTDQSQLMCIGFCCQFSKNHFRLGESVHLLFFALVGINMLYVVVSVVFFTHDYYIAWGTFLLLFLAKIPKKLLIAKASHLQPTGTRAGISRSSGLSYPN